MKIFLNVVGISVFQIMQKKESYKIAHEMYVHILNLKKTIYYKRIIFIHLKFITQIDIYFDYHVFSIFFLGLFNFAINFLELFDFIINLLELFDLVYFLEIWVENIPILYYNLIGLNTELKYFKEIYLQNQ